jgi:hypothetical protein
MSKKTRARSKTKSDLASMHDRVADFLGNLPAMRISIVAGVALLSIGLVVWGAGAARERVQGDERFFFDQWTLEIGDLPWWVTPEIEKDLQAAYRFDTDERISLFDEGAIDTLRRTFEKSPWVRSAMDIEFVYPTSERPGSILAVLALRTPIAMVQIGSDCYLVDADQRRLGESYLPSDQPWFAVPRIVGVHSGDAIPKQGERWAASDVVQGIAVARVLWDDRIQVDFPHHPIDAIDVSNVEGRARRGRSEVDLICGERVFEWGRSPLSTGSKVLSISNKLHNLRRVLADPRFGTTHVVSLYTTPLVGL